VRLRPMLVAKRIESADGLQKGNRVAGHLSDLHHATSIPSASPSRRYHLRTYLESSAPCRSRPPETRCLDAVDRPGHLDTSPVPQELRLVIDPSDRPSGHIQPITDLHGQKRQPRRQRPDVGISSGTDAIRPAVLATNQPNRRDVHGPKGQPQASPGQSGAPPWVMEDQETEALKGRHHRSWLFL
jgi:hypothetical protein